MIKVFAVIFLFLISLHARENPFFPSDGELDLSLTTNQTADYQPLKQATITLPSTARVLQKVTISYKNLDGTIEEKSIELQNSIDWHLPLFISQSYTSSFDDVKTIKVPLFKEF